MVRLYVRPAARGMCSTPAGKKSVLLSGGLVTRVQHGQLPHDQVAALMGGAVGHLMHRHTRFDIALEFWTIPAQLIRAVVMAIAGAPAWQSLTRFAWSTRPVAAGVAIVQAITEGHPAMGTVLAVVLALTYLTPWWTRLWAQRAQQECDQFVLDHGLGNALSDFLRLRPDPAVFDRIHHLSGTATRPAPALVRRSN